MTPQSFTQKQLKHTVNTLVDLTETPAGWKQLKKQLQGTIKYVGNDLKKQLAKNPRKPAVQKVKQKAIKGCAPELLIGVRGSGEPSEEQKAGSGDLGEVVLPQLAEAMGFKIGSENVYGLTYGAPDAMTYGSAEIKAGADYVVGAVQKLLGRPPDERPTGISPDAKAAGESLADMLRDQYKNCGDQKRDQKIVLAGYSQGAVIIRIAMAELNRTHDTGALGMVKGIATFGDPWLPPPLSDELQKRTKSACAPMDPICQPLASTLGDQLNQSVAEICAVAGGPPPESRKGSRSDPKMSIARAMCPHLNYATSGTYLEEAADYLKTELLLSHVPQ
ncbi:cutinase family protein [Streptomyces chattanoogensis]